MTDDAIDLGGGLSLVIVPADARDAVRKTVEERDALRAEVAEMEAEVHGHIKMWGDELRLRKAAEAERDALRAEVEKLDALMQAGFAEYERRLADAEAERDGLADRMREALENLYITPDNDREEGYHEGISAAIEALAALTTKGEADAG